MKELVYLKCQYCGEGFSELRRFLGHENFCKKRKIRVKDMKKFINRCGYCGKAFEKMEVLRIHERFCGGLTIDESLKPDNIKPTHYNKGKKDLIEMWYQTMTLEQFRGSMKSNIIKYTMRYENKNGIEDIDKAIEYLTRLKGYEEKTLG
ncbi:nucleotide kinase [Enterococcus phage AE4_17]|uniref:DNA binding protein n=1 Tax=Enterococcus phage AE4_17 TaxID=2759198 RepID=A0A7L7SHW8_9CAUD|nr:nucleotide kinase [Enterococcus phage AE4_17]QNR52529.1 DNA binding protein [Enterococcus phage ZEF1]QOC55073.1 DNA binding protein [Enterococcus phage AE4_17]